MGVVSDSLSEIRYGDGGGDGDTVGTKEGGPRSTVTEFLLCQYYQNPL